jgi:phosphoribosylamine--glycine ligase
LPGNPGISEFCDVFDVDLHDHHLVSQSLKEQNADLVVVGPEAPLIGGLADRLRSDGLAVVGPGSKGARLESSKAYAKALMKRAGIPTAPYAVFTDPRLAEAYAWTRFEEGRQVAVKASGPALGKGVVVCETLERANAAIRAFLVEATLGDAGREIVIEDRLRGPEFSLLTLCSGECIRSLPVARDYKRLMDGDRGPNTGGMGSIAPAPYVDAELVREAEDRVVRPILRALREDGIDYRGILFSGLLLEEGTPYCLEYNVRFGDPETQSVVRLLGEGFAEALAAAATGTAIPDFERLPGVAVSVVVASEGYPDRPVTGRTLTIGPLPEGVVAFHSGTRREGDVLTSAGGRVVAISAHAADAAEARRLAYQGVEAVRLEGMTYRRDIGAPR